MCGTTFVTVSPSSSQTSLKHAVRGRMLRPDVDEHVLGADLRLRNVERCDRAGRRGVHRRSHLTTPARRSSSTVLRAHRARLSFGFSARRSGFRLAAFCAGPDPLVART